jgi:hypothetical protein
MDFDLIVLEAFLASFSVFTVVFLLLRLRGRQKKAAIPNYRGFYPSAATLAFASISLQTMVQPDLNHALEQRQTEAAEDDDEGDPDNPAAQLSRQLKRIRYGEFIDTLRVPLCKRN